MLYLTEIILFIYWSLFILFYLDAKNQPWIVSIFQALKYEESYAEAIESFKLAHRLDPPWEPPTQELKELVGHLNYINHLLKNKGKIKAKRIVQMVKVSQQLSISKLLYSHLCPSRSNIDACLWGQEKTK